MSESPRNSLTIEEAVKFLKRYGCNPNPQDKPSEDYPLLHQALLLIVKESDWENLGVCADNPQQGLAAVKSYLAAFGYQDSFAEAVPDHLATEAIYIKFNTQKMSFYIDAYSGEYRGVLVAIQSEDDRVIGTYGYFPLDLFESCQ
ncbi:MAG: DUF1824 family protein [Xenococcus sp. MO_188.B8]|nr:DUF1824 family protein [Xenococcus sp. MO_188.B8]